MPYSEFVMWVEYLDNEKNTPGKIEYYLAQIAAEVRRTIAKDKNAISLKDFLNPVKFVRESRKNKPDSGALNRAKSFWFAATGFAGRKFKSKRKKR